MPDADLTVNQSKNSHKGKLRPNGFLAESWCPAVKRRPNAYFQLPFFYSAVPLKQHVSTFFLFQREV